jgi:FkbM family methyltransferase
VRLIYDIGMHNGSDTAYYLRKGFDVVAIEANPRFVEKVKTQFAPQIQSGQLTIYNVALTESEGEFSFFLHDHDDWSRLDLKLDHRFEEGTYQEIKVRGVPFTTIYQRHPLPYYAKLDIEGPEFMVLSQMMSTRRYPPFVSVEVNLEVDAMLDLLGAHGYTAFYLLGQYDKSWIKLPHPPKEGNYFETSFHGLMSGPFGNEIPGPWVSMSDVKAQIADHKERGRQGDESARSEWFDIHARHASAP